MITWRKFPLVCSCKLRVLLRAEKQGEKSYWASDAQKKTVACLLKVFSRCNCFCAIISLSKHVSGCLNISLKGNAKMQACW